ncbi:hypothetical protein NHX12_010049 [Muraenolepis orangiensis]|uniref:Cilia- and flagella-associated protein 54 n=1 Tax=Muraenolepis orangiensis TaxID=630683 RepID=A0A9Q0DMC1_9TELE|nr:hypothetical protein NHX12_010049 [Muraenolepis orangiensis]
MGTRTDFPASYYGKIDDKNPVVRAFKKEIQSFVALMKRVTSSPPVRGNNTYTKGVQTLVEIWKKYKHRLPLELYHEHVLRTADALLLLKLHHLALWQGYSLYLMDYTRVHLGDPATDMDYFRERFFPKGFHTDQAHLRMKVRALQGCVQCVLEQEKAAGDLTQQGLGRLLHVLQLTRLMMQACQPYEHLSWHLHNGSLYVYDICRYLMNANYSAQALEFLLYASICLELSVTLATPEFLPWKTTLYCAVCQCYYDSGAPAKAEVFARRALGKVNDLARLEEHTGPLTADIQRTYREARIKLSVMVFKRMASEQRPPAGPAYLLLTRPDSQQEAWHQTPTGQLLGDLFEGCGAAHFLALLEALGDGRPLLHTRALPEEPETQGVLLELLATGISILSGTSGAKGRQEADGEASWLGCFSALTTEPGQLELAVSGGDRVCLPSALRFVQLLFHYQQHGVFTPLARHMVQALQEMEDLFGVVLSEEFVGLLEVLHQCVCNSAPDVWPDRDLVLAAVLNIWAKLNAAFQSSELQPFDSNRFPDHHQVWNQNPVDPGEEEAVDPSALSILQVSLTALDLNLELLKALHRASLKRLQLCHEDVSEADLLDRIKKNKVSKALFLTQKALVVHREMGPNRGYRTKTLLEEAMVLIEKAEAEERKLYKPRTTQPSTGREEDRDDGPPPAPLLLFRTNHSLTFVPATYHTNQQVCWYQICGRAATAANLRVRLGDCGFYGTGHLVPVVGGQCELTVEGLEHNQKYVFAVAAYGSQGALLGNAIGHTTRPMLASIPLPTLSTWALLAQVAFETEQFAVAKRACGDLWRHFTQSDSTRTPQTNLSLAGLHVERLEGSSPLLLQWFLASVFIETDINVQRGALFCDSLSDKGPLIWGQNARLAECERLLLAVDVSLWCGDSSAGLQAVVSCYDLLAPLLYHGIVWEPIVQVLMKCLAALEENSSLFKESRSTETSQALLHMVACITYYLSRALRVLEQPEASLVMERGQKLLQRTYQAQVVLKAQDPIIPVYHLIANGPLGSAYQDVMKLKGNTCFPEAGALLLQRAMAGDTPDLVVRWGTEIFSCMHRNDRSLGVSTRGTEGRQQGKGLTKRKKPQQKRPGATMPEPEADRELQQVEASIRHLSSLRLSRQQRLQRRQMFGEQRVWRSQLNHLMARAHLALLHRKIQHKRAAVLAHRGAHWSCLRYVCQTAREQSSGLAGLLAGDPDREGPTPGPEAPCPTALDLLHATFTPLLGLATDLLMDMMDTLGLWAVFDGDASQEDLESGLGSQVDLRWVQSLVLDTLGLLHTHAQWESLAHYAMLFNCYTRGRYTLQVSPLLVHAQRRLLERVSELGGPPVPQPHHVKTHSYTGTLVYRSMCLVRVPLDVEDTLAAYRLALQNQPHSLHLLQHSPDGVQQGGVGLGYPGQVELCPAVATGPDPQPPDLTGQDFTTLSHLYSLPIGPEHTHTVITAYSAAIKFLEGSELRAQALHELGNLQLYSGNTRAARSSWSKAVDCALQSVGVLDSWDGVSWAGGAQSQQDTLKLAGVRGCLQAAVITAKTAQYALVSHIHQRTMCCLLSAHLFKLLPMLALYLHWVRGRCRDVHRTVEGTLLKVRALTELSMFGQAIKEAVELSHGQGVTLPYDTDISRDTERPTRKFQDNKPILENIPAVEELVNCSLSEEVRGRYGPVLCRRFGLARVQLVLALCRILPGLPVPEPCGETAVNSKEPSVSPAGQNQATVDTESSDSRGLREPDRLDLGSGREKLSPERVKCILLDWALEALESSRGPSQGWGEPECFSSAQEELEIAVETQLLLIPSPADCPRAAEVRDRLGAPLWLQCRLALLRGLAAHLPRTAIHPGPDSGEEAVRVLKKGVNECVSWGDPDTHALMLLEAAAAHTRRGPAGADPTNLLHEAVSLLSDRTRMPALSSLALALATMQLSAQRGTHSTALLELGQRLLQQQLTVFGESVEVKSGEVILPPQGFNNIYLPQLPLLAKTTMCIGNILALRAAEGSSTSGPESSSQADSPVGPHSPQPQLPTGAHGWSVAREVLRSALDLCRSCGHRDTQLEARLLYCRGRPGLGYRGYRVYSGVLHQCYLEVASLFLQDWQNIPPKTPSTSLHKGSYWRNLMASLKSRLTAAEEHMLPFWVCLRAAYMLSRALRAPAIQVEEEEEVYRWSISPRPQLCVQWVRAVHAELCEVCAMLADRPSVAGDPLSATAVLSQNLHAPLEDTTMMVLKDRTLACCVSIQDLLQPGSRPKPLTQVFDTLEHDQLQRVIHVQSSIRLTGVWVLFQVPFEVSMENVRYLQQCFDPSGGALLECSKLSEWILATLVNT